MVGSRFSRAMTTAPSLPSFTSRAEALPNTPNANANPTKAINSLVRKPIWLPSF